MLTCQSGMLYSVLTTESALYFPCPFPNLPGSYSSDLTAEGSVMLFGVLTCSMPPMHCLSRRLSLRSVRQPHGPIVPGISLNGNVMCVRVPLLGGWVSTFWLFLTVRDRSQLCQHLLGSSRLVPTSREPAGGFSPEPIHGSQSSSL